MLQRPVKTPRLAWADQAVLATLAQLLPKGRSRRLHLIVFPRTLLHWHVGLIHRRPTCRTVAATRSRDPALTWW